QKLDARAEDEDVTVRQLDRHGAETHTAAPRSARCSEIANVEPIGEPRDLDVTRSDLGIGDDERAHAYEIADDRNVGELRRCPSSRTTADHEPAARLR